ncbi:hypothetical protein FO519_010111 [Halicephalobus sp. NKZ332]|nr:hypothetical protein FO519_010111 [Halicephalobus sp. NKZ332]
MRNSYTAEYKLRIIYYAKESGVTEAAHYFGIHRRRIYDWIPLEDELKQLNRKTRTRSTRRGKWPELEKELKVWTLDQRKHGFQVNTNDLRIRGQELALEKGIENFTGCPKWCHSFMRRQNLSIRARTSIGQPMPDGHHKKVDDFHRFVEKEMINVSLENLGNMDEVPVPFETVGNRTIDQKGKDDIFIATSGYHRSFFTVVLTVTATEGVVVLVNQKGWFTNETMKNWINVWNERSGYDANPEKSLIIMDSARSHLHQEARNELKKVSKVAIIPGGCTRFTQPLDISVNRSFKNNLRTHWAAWYADEAQAEYTKKGKRKKPRYEVVAQWVKSSFENVDTECVINGFKKGLTPEHNYRMESITSAFTSLAIDDDEEPESDDEVSDQNTTIDSMDLDT